MNIAEANRVTSFLCNSCIEMLKVIYPLVEEDLNDDSADNLPYYDHLGDNVMCTLNFADLVLSEVTKDEMDELKAATAKDVSEKIRATKVRIIEKMWTFRTRAKEIDGSWEYEVNAFLLGLMEEENHQSNLEAIRTCEGSLREIVKELEK